MLVAGPQARTRRHLRPRETLVVSLATRYSSRGPIDELLATKLENLTPSRSEDVSAGTPARTHTQTDGHIENIMPPPTLWAVRGVVIST